MGSDPRTALARLAEPALGALCRRHHVRVLTAFGSATRSDGEPRDLDLAVLFEPGGRRDLLGLLGSLTDLTGSDDIDLMDLGRADSVARERALVGCIPLYESEAGAFATAQMSAITERMDTDWLRRLDLELMRR